MEIIKQIPEIRAALRLLRADFKSISLIPTMGALHRGHLELIRQAKAESDVVVVSIYVNPTQFNNPLDLEKYPRDLPSDLKLLESEGVDFVFVPDDKIMYPSPMSIAFTFFGLDEILEGAYRPGHFNGVAVVVSKLFHIIAPDLAYFGQKDLQQVSVVRQLVRDLNFDVKIIVVPTVREADGLALSSRNQRLNPNQREQAPILYSSLIFAKTELLRGVPWFEVHEIVKANFKTASAVDLEYLQLVDVEGFVLAKERDPKIKQALCIAAYLGDVRLIDNLMLTD